MAELNTRLVSAVDDNYLTKEDIETVGVEYKGLSARLMPNLSHRAMPDLRVRRLRQSVMQSPVKAGHMVRASSEAKGILTHRF